MRDARDRLHTTREVQVVLAMYLSPRLVEEVVAKLSEGKLDASEVKPQITEEQRARLRAKARRLLRRGGDG